MLPYVSGGGVGVSKVDFFPRAFSEDSRIDTEVSVTPEFLKAVVRMRRHC
jgi:hypothetical protein